MKLYGLIGYPLSHSISSRFFKEKFATEGIDDCQYQNFELSDLTLLPDLIINNEHLCGLNITIPFKIAVLPYIHKLSEEAKEIGAVNTIKINRINNNYSLEGYNTDAYAFFTTLAPLLKNNHKKAIILGTGGAAKAAAFSLKKLNIEYRFISRTADKPNTSKYNQIPELLQNGHNIIINATPVGMHPNIKDFPNLPYHLITSEFIVYDMIYNPELTKLLKLAAQQGANIINGKAMLIEQAQQSWNIWQNTE